MPQRTVTIQLPLPPKGLSPNARVHWASKMRATAEYRETCGWLVKGDHPPLKPPLTGRVTFYVPDKRRRDVDNLVASLKPALDGFADAGLIRDDSDIVSLVASIVVRKGEPGVVIELTERGSESLDTSESEV